MRVSQGPSGLEYVHHGDFSGEVRVCLPAHLVEVTEHGAEVGIPFEDMKHLVLAELRSRAINVLEQADDETLERFFSWSSGQ